MHRRRGEEYGNFHPNYSYKCQDTSTIYEKWGKLPHNLSRVRIEVNLKPLRMFRERYICSYELPTSVKFERTWTHSAEIYMTASHNLPVLPSTTVIKFLDSTLNVSGLYQYLKVMSSY